jgi:hypothetical protein
MAEARARIHYQCVRERRWGFWIGRNMILRRVKKPGYLIELRLIGIVCLWAAVILGWALLAPKHY